MECTLTEYIIEDDTGSVSTIFISDSTTYSDKIIITCLNPSCVLNLDTYNFKVKA